MHRGYALTFGHGEHRHDLLQKARERSLLIIDRPSLLLVAEPQTAFLESGNCVLIGHLFTETNRRVDALPEGFAQCTEARNLSDALSGYWGNFALFSAFDKRCIAYRDPSGTIPIFRCGGGSHSMFVSDAGIADRLGLLGDGHIDLEFAVHWLQFPFLRTGRTGLLEVAEILPGVLAEQNASGGWSERLLWRPRDFVRKRSAIRDAGVAQVTLRNLAMPVVATQVQAETPLLELSGGLDSSIVAACLSERASEIPCVNFATKSADGDERGYARDVANAFGFVLTELIESEPTELALDERRSFRPSTNPLLAPFEQAVGDVAKERGASVLIDGAGGDNLFCSIASASPVLDALFWNGPGEANRAALNIARRAGCTWWEVWAAAAKRMVRRRPAWKEDCSFLRREMLLRRPELHPWLTGLKRVPPGKREHVEALVHIQHFLDRGFAPVARLHPLLAQPMLETCLRIPTWLWMTGGRDRAIARDAFAGLLPQSVLDRRSKGSLQSWFHRSFERLRPRMHDLLRSGELHRLGIIDAIAVGSALEGTEWSRADIQLRVSEMIALELWLQSWRAGGEAPARCA